MLLKKETFFKQTDSILFTLPPICVMPVIIKEAKWLKMSVSKPPHLLFLLIHKFDESHQMKLHKLLFTSRLARQE